jgi:hypothetical protein
MQFGNRTFFISENVSDHYARRFAREISLRCGKMTADPCAHADYIIYDAEKDLKEPEEQDRSAVKITVNEMVRIIDSAQLPESDGFCVIGSVLVKWIPEESVRNTLKIPNGVTRIKGDAFRAVYPCQETVFRNKRNGIIDIKLPKTLRVIEPDAFRGFEQLTSIELPGGLQEAGGFRGCVRLNHVKIPECCTKIGEHAFEGCRSLTDLQWSESITEIGRCALKGTPLARFSSWEQLKTIGEEAFAGCKRLSEVTLGGKDIECAKYCFKASGIKKLTVSADSCVLKSCCFSGCTKLLNLEIEKGRVTVTATAFPNETLRNRLSLVQHGTCPPAELAMWHDVIRTYKKRFISRLSVENYIDYAAMCAEIAGIKNFQIDWQEVIRKEALSRIGWLVKNVGLNPKVGRYYREGKLYYSYLTAGGFMGSIDTINYNPRYAEIVKQTEETYGVKVYHAIESTGMSGRELVLLYVDRLYRDWPYGRPKSTWMMAYVHSFELDEGEFGDVELSSYQGALYRIG